MCGCLSHAPNWGPGLQPRHVPWLGIEPATPCFAGWHSIHWATPTRTKTPHSSDEEMEAARRWVVFPRDTQLAGGRMDSVASLASGPGVPETPVSSMCKAGGRSPGQSHGLCPIDHFLTAESQAEPDRAPQDGQYVATSTPAPGTSNENTTLFPLGLCCTSGFSCLFPKVYDLLVFHVPS